MSVLIGREQMEEEKKRYREKVPSEKVKGKANKSDKGIIQVKVYRSCKF